MTDQEILATVLRILRENEEKARDAGLLPPLEGADPNDLLEYEALLEDEAALLGDEESLDLEDDEYDIEDEAPLTTNRRDPGPLAANARAWAERVSGTMRLGQAG